MLPAVLIYLGILFRLPVEMTLLIHLVVELLIPTLIVRAFSDSELFRVQWKINRFEGSAVMGILLGIFFCGLVVFLYWLIDKVFGWDLEDNLLRTPLPQNRILEIIAAFYLVVIVPYIEEWYWRRYNYYMFYRNEINYWITSILWSTAYLVVAYMTELELRGMIFMAACFIIFGRIQIVIMGTYEAFGAYMTHMGASFGIMLCYFLEKNNRLGDPYK
jgi:membrane protease YdiL (CAAX protease family)